MQIELDLSNILLDQFVVQLGECNVVGWDGRRQKLESPNHQIGTSLYKLK